MPRLPLWFVLRGLVWNAVLIWILVMVGKQFVRNFQWPTNWRDAGASITVLVIACVWLWFVFKQVGRAVENAKISAATKGKNLESAKRKTEGGDKK
jgi:Co/Zn/Cd efflux system component